MVQQIPAISAVKNTHKYITCRDGRHCNEATAKIKIKTSWSSQISCCLKNYLARFFGINLKLWSLFNQTYSIVDCFCSSCRRRGKTNGMRCLYLDTDLDKDLSLTPSLFDVDDSRAKPFPCRYSFLTKTDLRNLILLSLVPSAQNSLERRIFLKPALPCLVLSHLNLNFVFGFALRSPVLSCYNSSMSSSSPRWFKMFFPRCCWLMEKRCEYDFIFRWRKISDVRSIMNGD